MGNVDLISRYVVYLPDSDERGREGLAQIKGAAGRIGFSVVYDGAYLLATASNSGTALARTYDSPLRFLLDVFPGSAMSPRLTALPEDVADGEALHRFAEENAQPYNLLQLTGTTFALESDALGLKPVFLAEVLGGKVLASRIGDVLALFPQLAEPADTVALYELMTFRTPLARRTLHRQIRRGSAGGCYRWRRNTAFSVGRDRRIQPAAVEPPLFMDEVTQRVKETFAVSLKEKTARAGSNVVLALSGGFDSRLVAAVCCELGIRLRVLSYGRRPNEESYSARAVARALKLKLEEIHYDPDNSLHHLDHHLEVLEGTADLATSSVMNLFQADTAPGTPLLHGYGGDVLSGNWVSRLTGAEYGSREALAKGVLRFHHEVATRSDVRRLLMPAVDPEDVRQDVFLDLRDDCPPHQAFMLWEFENRQRTYVGSYFPLLGGHFDTIMPFYDRRLFEVWTSIPPIGLVDRTVFRKLLARYYPALARIPHPEEPVPVIPNLRWQLARLRRSLPRRVLERTLGVRRTKELLLRSYRHDYIWNLGNLAAPQQRAHMLARVAELRPVLKEALGVDLAPGYEGILADDVQALRGMFLAAEYARRRAAGQAP